MVVKTVFKYYETWDGNGGYNGLTRMFVGLLGGFRSGGCIFLRCESFFKKNLR